MKHKELDIEWVNESRSQDHVQNSYRGSTSSIEDIVCKKEATAIRKGISAQIHGR